MTELSQKRLSGYVIIKLGYFLSAHSVCFLPNIEIWMVEVLGLCLEEDISLGIKKCCRKISQTIPEFTLLVVHTSSFHWFTRPIIPCNINIPSVYKPDTYSMLRSWATWTKLPFSWRMSTKCACMFVVFVHWFHVSKSILKLVGSLSSPLNVDGLEKGKTWGKKREFFGN